MAKKQILCISSKNLINQVFFVFLGWFKPFGLIQTILLQSIYTLAAITQIKKMVSPAPHQGWGRSCRDRPGTIFRPGTGPGGRVSRPGPGSAGAGDAIGDVHTTTSAPAPAMFTRRGRGDCENREKRSIYASAVITRTIKNELLMFRWSCESKLRHFANYNVSVVARYDGRAI